MNNQKTKFKNQTSDIRPQTSDISGITLIALIITIIVMLILVTVTISVVVNSGLFGHASDSTTAWDVQQTREQIIVDLMGRYDNSGNYTNDDVIESVKAVTGQDIEEGTATVTTAKGNELDISDLWKEMEADNTAVNKLVTGDYVLYEAKTGENLLCKVLYDRTSEFGLCIRTNDSVQDISLQLESEDDYDELESTWCSNMNEISVGFLNSQYSNKSTCLGSTIWNTGETRLALFFDECRLAEDLDFWPSYIEVGSSYAGNDFDNPMLHSCYWDYTSYIEKYWNIGMFTSNYGTFGYTVAAEYRCGSCGETYYVNNEILTHGVCCVFDIKDEVLISGGNGTEDDPYMLSVRDQ